jgi:hypothetical protein
VVVLKMCKSWDNGLIDSRSVMSLACFRLGSNSGVQAMNTRNISEVLNITLVFRLYSLPSQQRAKDEASPSPRCVRQSG